MRGYPLINFGAICEGVTSPNYDVIMEEHALQLPFSSKFSVNELSNWLVENGIPVEVSSSFEGLFKKNPKYNVMKPTMPIFRQRYRR